MDRSRLRGGLLITRPRRRLDESWPFSSRKAPGKQRPGNNSLTLDLLICVSSPSSLILSILFSYFLYRRFIGSSVHFIDFLSADR